MYSSSGLQCGHRRFHERIEFLTADVPLRRESWRGEAHNRAELMEFKYLVEQRAILGKSGRHTVDYARMPGSLASLAKELLEIEAAGDRGRAEAWFTKYGTMPPALKTPLAAASDIPVDIAPVFSSPGEGE
jgi:hypothetical protein